MAPKKVTLATLQAMKERGQKAVYVTAYDYPTATFAERAGVDMILVGDSAAMTMMGFPNTLGVGMDEMMVFIKSVCRAAASRAYVVGDMPFLSYQISDELAIANAGRFVAAGCDAVKCEGGIRVAGRVKAMVDAGIAVMGHLGLTPQNLAQLGGYKVQGKSLSAVEKLCDDALALQAAGASSILLEAMPVEAAAYIHDRLDILIFGIGAGPHVDGQLVISHDILGNFVGDIAPKFVKPYATIGADVEKAFRTYADEVRSGVFPGPAQWYPIDAEQEAEIKAHRATHARTAAPATIPDTGKPAAPAAPTKAAQPRS